jgi:hypothetical protein
VAARLERRWQTLCDGYLPVRPPESTWRFSREHRRDDPDQGWKLHISATVPAAARVLRAVAPVLDADGALFKAPNTLIELNKLNCGYFYGTSQIGKFLTVYPQGPREAARLAARLDEVTRGMPGPGIPFERAYRRGSRVFYRYGSFESRYGTFAGETLPALREPDGTLIPDVRSDPGYEPSWCPNPFPAAPLSPRRTSRFRDRYLVYEPLTQRGKGGVYKALDMAETPMRPCVVKEGRRHGETDWQGRDGRAFVLTEIRVLHDLAAAGLRVPAIKDTFEEQRNVYLVLEYLGSRTLEEVVRTAGRLPVADALRLAAALAALVARIHEAGWVWRDIKPRNVIMDDAGDLRPIDFEGACRRGARNVPPWGSDGYLPPGWQGALTDQIGNDLFALGVSCRQILIGARSFGLPADAHRRDPIGRRRHGVPPEARQLITALLEDDPARRPTAKAAAECLITVA